MDPDFYAFPMCNELGELYSFGLSKREYFAAMAMQGYLSNPNLLNEHKIESGQELAEKAFMIADNMLKQSK